MLSAKQGGIKYHFWVFMTLPGIEPWFPRLLENTLTTWPMDQYYILLAEESINCFNKLK